MADQWPNKNIFGFYDFITWDSEGANDSEDEPQRTILFGCHTPDGHRFISGHSLETEAMIELMFDIAEEYPDAIHVGFAFGYDSNMIVRHLRQPRLEELYQDGKTTFYAGKYSVKWIPNKLVSFTSRAPKRSITVYDVFTFFAQSFVVTARKLLGDSPELQLVEEEKKNRGSFADRDINEVIHYWKLETELLTECMKRFRSHVFNAGFSRLVQWHGPGAIANLLFERENIGAYMSRSIPSEVNRAAQYAYAGGRFEPFKIGRHDGKVYGYDLNSAYPYAISQLPCLACGTWERVEHPHTIARFGIYRIDLRTPDALFWQRPAPLFYRDAHGNIAYPHVVSGWYFSPEADLVLHHPNAEIIEGWEYRTDCDHQPFAWVPETYRKRQLLRKLGNPSQMALKLGLNSLYGKMAQRVGWNERKRTPPRWHQLEWAGWVTSMCRRKMFGLISRVPWEDLISVETDGVYCTTPPEKLGVESSTELGGWSVEEYDEGIFLQSGLYFLRSGSEWIRKVRGFDKDSFETSAVLSYLKQQKHKWNPLSGKTTRFIGLGAALQSTEDFRKKHCRWEISSKEITPGEADKRWHFPEKCRACLEDKNGYDTMHDLCIKPPGGESFPHVLPWVEEEWVDGEKESEYGWRQGELIARDKLRSLT